jgi:hypothetical protein
MSQSISDKVKAINLLKKQALELGLTVSSEAIDSDSLTETALGTCKVDGKWMLAFIKYNPDTKEAVVSELKSGEDGRSGTAERFKIEAAYVLPVFNEEN